MEIPRAVSPASSVSSLDSNGLPIGRIKCCKEKIFVGEKHFLSASDALLVYLRQFDNPSPLTNGSHGAGRSKQNGALPGAANGSTKSSVSIEINGICTNDKKDDVQELLTSKVSPELKEEVTDTLREIKLKNLLKKAVSKSQKPGKTGLQQEVEAALARSAQLLEKVTMEDIQSAKTTLSDTSDISLPTHILLGDSRGSSKSNDSILSQDTEDFRAKQNGHLYSYNTPDYLNRSRSKLRHLHVSCDDLTLPNNSSSPHRLSPSASSNSSIRLSDLSDNLRQLRSRSVPPGLVRNEATQLLDELNAKSGRRSIPSWIKEVSSNSSIVSNSNKSCPSPSSKPPVIPQWVEDAAKSDISILDIENKLIPSMQTLSNGRQLSNSILLSKSEGDLSHWKEDFKSEVNLSNSITSPTHPSEKHVTFTDSLNIPSVSHQPHHSTPIRSRFRQKINSDLSTRNKAMNGYSNSDPHLDSNDNAANQTSFNENMFDNESDLKSSSLDTLALLTGKTQIRLERSDVLKGRTFGQRVFSDSHILSSIEQDRTAISPTSSGNGQASSDGLDGDRSWEKHTNTFKPPVPVGTGDRNDEVGARKNMSSSLSGGNQPGTMETLKNMLFKLQKEESSVNTNDSNTNNTEQTASNPTPPSLPALQDYNFETEPGGHSLEKALHHLDRLKTLVKNTASNSQPEIVNGHGGTESNSIAN